MIDLLITFTIGLMLGFGLVTLMERLSKGAGMVALIATLAVAIVALLAVGHLALVEGVKIDPATRTLTLCGVFFGWLAAVLSHSRLKRRR